VLSGGSSLPEAVIEEFTTLFGCSIHEGYGLSETSPTVAVNHVREETAPGTVGTALWGIDLRIAAPDDDGLTFLPTGEIGEVIVRGHGLFLGYQNDPEATAGSYVDGWFRTGDLGRLDPAGRLTIVDRTKDLIIRGGYNVYPREIEEVLARMPGVRRVAVFGVPDDRLGQEVVVAVIAEPPVTAGDVLAYAQERIARHKYPRKAMVVDDFPLGPSGKILKRELSRRWTEQDSVAG
jgi:long-chain acyl-CoA synthetase